MDKKVDKFLYPETAKEALDKFESGQPIFVVSLGGLGPGYEQSIWNSIFQVIRAFHNRNIDNWVKGGEWDKNTHDKLLKVITDDDLSGAQFGVIRNTAWCVMKHGWKETIKKAPKERLIQVSRHFPEYR